MKHKFINKTLSITKTILITLAELGEISFKSFYCHPYYHSFCNHKKNKSVDNAFDRLLQSDLIDFTKEGHQKFFFLTTKGKTKTSQLLENIISQAQVWDNKWRICIYDVREKDKIWRDFLRWQLYKFGFKQLQKSVWISPHKTSEKLKEIISKSGNLTDCVRFLIVEEISSDKDLKKMFKL